MLLSFCLCLHSVANLGYLWHTVPWGAVSDVHKCSWFKCRCSCPCSCPLSQRRLSGSQTCMDRFHTTTLVTTHDTTDLLCQRVLPGQCRQILIIHTPPGFPQSLKNCMTQACSYSFVFSKFTLCISPLAVLYVRQAESQLVPITKQNSMIKNPRYSSIFSLSHAKQAKRLPTRLACERCRRPWWKPLKKALAPPDQIGKEALAYLEFLGQKPYTINSGKMSNMHMIGMWMHTVHN